MTTPQRIYRLLLDTAGIGICDDCVQDAVGASTRSTVNLVTGAFALTSDFTKSKGECSKCGKVKHVSSATGARRARG